MRAHLNWLVVGAVAGTVLGLVIGWSMGAWTTCGNSCSFDVALFEAIGTWVGGVGVAAVAGGYVGFRARRDRQAALIAAENEALALARDCAIRLTPLGDEHNGYHRVNIEFENKLAERVYAVGLRTIENEELRSDAQVGAGRTWGTAALLPTLGLEEHYATELEARQALRRRGKSRVIFTCTIRGFVFERVGNIVSVVLRPDRPHKPGE
ncbi:hypothetical protein [Microbacterium sp. GXF0217]